MSGKPSDDPEKVFSFLVADALEALLPLIDDWAENVTQRRHGEHLRAYAEGYDMGVKTMAAEVKDQLIERILRLRG